MTEFDLEAVQEKLLKIDIVEKFVENPSLCENTKISSDSSKFALLGKGYQEIYENKKCNEKPLINLAVVGHVDAGKSTLMGHLLFKLGCVHKKTMQKHEQNSKEHSKASFMYAWVLDETAEERCRGITMDVAVSKFETLHRNVNLLDTPGHKDFVPNMINGTAQADVAILVVDATRGEFETGFETGGQTKEHTMLLRSLGISQLVVAVNKLDNVNWDQERYDEIVSKLLPFLKLVGFKDCDTKFVPCSGLSGENLIEYPQNTDLSKWYSGQTLIDAVDSFIPPERLVSKPLRMCIRDVFKCINGKLCASGRIEAGYIQSGDKVLVMPAAELAVIKSIIVNDITVQHSFAGDHVVLQVSGININNVTSSSVICDVTFPIKVTTYFQAKLVIFNITIPITNGFPVVLHYQNVIEQALVAKILSSIHRSTGQIVKTKPRCLTKNSSAVVELKVLRPICLELYKDFADLGRFMLRSGGSTIAAGWFNQHEYIYKLSLQASINVLSEQEEIVKESFISSGKIPVVVHELLLIEIWKEKILPEILKLNFQLLSAIPLYTVMYHEATIASLLEAVMFHEDMVDSLSDVLIDLIDYSQRKIIRLMQSSKKKTAEENVSVRKEELADLLSKEDSLSFDIGMKAISFVSYITQNLKILPLCALHRLLFIHDVPVVLANLLCEMPWHRTASDGSLEKYSDGRWNKVCSANRHKITKVEGQIWIAMIQLLLNPECQKKYDISGYRKDQLLKVRAKVNEVVIDQIPLLQELLRFLEHLSLFEPPPSKPDIVIEQVSEIRESILMRNRNKWASIAKQQVKEFFSPSESQLETICKRLSSAYDMESLEVVLPDKPVCATCHKTGNKRCSRCKNEWYCGRKCQVEHWTKHKPACNLMMNDQK